MASLARAMSPPCVLACENLSVSFVSLLLCHDTIDPAIKYVHSCDHRSPAFGHPLPQAGEGLGERATVVT